MHVGDTKALVPLSFTVTVTYWYDDCVGLLCLDISDVACRRLSEVVGYDSEDRASKRSLEAGIMMQPR